MIFWHRDDPMLKYTRPSVKKVNKCFVCLHRHYNRPQLLLHDVSNPKDWKKFVFMEEVGPSRPLWVRESDDRPFYPLC